MENKRLIPFNVNATVTPPSDTTVSNATKRIFTPNTRCNGPSWSNYFRANRITSYSVTGKSVSIQSTESYGVGFPFAVKTGQRYCFTYNAVTASAVSHVIFYKSDGSSIVYGDTEINGLILTVPNEATMMVIILLRKYGAASGDVATFTDIRLWQM